MNVYEFYLCISIILIVLGLYTLISKRNLIKIVLGLEVMTLGVNLAIITMGVRVIGGTYEVDAFAQGMVAISMAIGAAVAALALSIAMNIYRHYKTFDVKKLRRLRW
ncbi:MAG: cation:proton antiporter [Candidatus Methanomethylicota archaeon]|uniref:Cation:proton antiporter n=1 Tax=Thermoproteota archaeon TaxID=2056631 RepID=A0A497EJT9_9CREN|nr:MAG: cation:proton antiporter [Candidatus Verstraetearchaeota archaeon]